MPSGRGEKKKPVPLLSQSASPLHASCVAASCPCLVHGPDHRPDEAVGSGSRIASSGYRFVFGLPQSTLSGNQSHSEDRRREAVELRRCWDHGGYAARCRTFPSSSIFLSQDKVSPHRSMQKRERERVIQFQLLACQQSVVAEVLRYPFCVFGLAGRIVERCFDLASFHGDITLFQRCDQTVCRCFWRVLHFWSKGGDGRGTDCEVGLKNSGTGPSALSTLFHGSYSINSSNYYRVQLTTVCYIHA